MKDWIKSFKLIYIITLIYSKLYLLINLYSFHILLSYIFIYGIYITFKNSLISI